MSKTPDSNDPFPQVDSNHGGPSRDVIAVYLRQLRDGFSDLSVKLDDHKEKTSSALEEIRISIAKSSQVCPRAEQCKNVFDRVEVLWNEKTAIKASIATGRIFLVFLGSLVGAASAIAATWFLFFPKGRP